MAGFCTSLVKGKDSESRGIADGVLDDNVASGKKCGVVSLERNFSLAAEEGFIFV